MGRCVSWSACVTLLAAVNAGASNPALKHVIITDAVLAALFARGYERSETLRRLTEDIESSGWTVFVISGACPIKEAIGCLLHTVGRFDGRPYLRVKVRVRERHPDAVLETVAHELQHAREVAASAAVHDNTSLAIWLGQIKSSAVKVSGGLLYETKAARAIEAQVGRELRRSP